MGTQYKKFEAHASGGPRIREIPMRMVLPNLVTVLAICAGLSGIRHGGYVAASGPRLHINGQRS